MSQKRTPCLINPETTTNISLTLRFGSPAKYRKGELERSNCEVAFLETEMLTKSKLLVEFHWFLVDFQGKLINLYRMLKIKQTMDFQ